MLDNNKPEKIPWTLLFTFLIITVIISITGFYIYNNQKAEIKSKIYSDLSSISKSKLEQIIEWRKDRLSDAYKIVSNQSFIYDVQKWLSNKNEKEIKQRIEKYLDAVQRDSNYTDLVLLDTEYNIRLSRDGNDILSEYDKKNLQTVSKTKKILITDLHRSEIYSAIHIDCICPLILESKEKKDLIGFMIIRINSWKFLYPVIQSWPTLSKSAETLLIRRENDHVLFLNELRFKKNTALNLTFPLSDTLLPATKAALGLTGIFE